MGVKTHLFLFPVVANQLPVETTKEFLPNNFTTIRS
jgi:hypothetical protein